MSKKTVINEIMDVYEENERLKTRINRLIEKYETTKPCVCREESEQQTSEDMLNEIGKEMLFENTVSSWNLPSVKVKENDGQFNFLTFDQWVKAIERDAFKYGRNDTKKIIDEVPLTKIKQYFEKQLKNYYTKEVNDKKMELVRAAKENKDE